MEINSSVKSDMPFEPYREVSDLPYRGKMGKVPTLHFFPSLKWVRTTPKTSKKVPSEIGGGLK
jgi:hypothetical protein